MKRLSATEASRRFSDLLDRVERNRETFVVERHGRVVASIAPAAAASGQAVKQLLRSQAKDPGWAAELRELRATVEPEERRWTG